MTPLRFGVLGLSPGNGHPYSWSAIFNGYEPAEMARCPFPVIPAYLAEQTFPDATIAGASVTHVWTQDPEVSQHVAAAARIAHIVADYRDMIGAVDGVLLARDDAERHYEMAEPFLDAGLPVYIDKPLALSVAEAQRLYDRQQRPGQIFTCSALAYAREFRPSADVLAALGTLRYVECITIKDWDKYAIHVLEPLQALTAEQGEIVHMTATGTSVRHLDVQWPSGLTGRITALGSSAGNIAIRLYGERGWREMVFRDTFTAFKAALQHFTDIVAGRVPPQDPAEVLKVMRMVEAGRRRQEPVS